MVEFKPLYVKILSIFNYRGHDNVLTLNPMHIPMSYIRPL